MAMTALAALGAESTVRLLTLDPGHFHAALVQKFMYPQVDPTVHVYSPGGPDLEQHLKRIDGFNARPEDPTRWNEVVYSGPDFFAKMVGDKAGNVVVISGNNALKGKYILACVQAGLNVLADKPMAITPEDFQRVKQALEEAPKRNVLLYDIMPERFEIATILQRELARREALFGTLERGTPENPAVIEEDVHYYFKTVAGKPLIRPPWFFDVNQQGEGIVDVMTHQVDLVQWTAFPEEALSPDDATVLNARRWTTALTPQQFQRATQLAEYPDYLRPVADNRNVLQIYANGSFVYTLRGVHARVGVEWRFEPAPTEGPGDSHYSVLRGSKADLFVRQGIVEGFKPTLYVEKRSALSDADFERALREAVGELRAAWPGVDVAASAKGWALSIPDRYRDGHEAHFASVTRNYLNALAKGALPVWEVPGMLTKYATIMQAYRISHSAK
jgi:predicted dehydrogenase